MALYDPIFNIACEITFSIADTFKTLIESTPIPLVVIFLHSIYCFSETYPDIQIFGTYFDHVFI